MQAVLLGKIGEVGLPVRFMVIRLRLKAKFPIRKLCSASIIERVDQVSPGDQFSYSWFGDRRRFGVRFVLDQSKRFA